MRDRMLNATLVQRIEVTPELLILRVKPDSGIPDFVPGQYVALGLPAAAARPLHFPPERDPQTGDKIIKRAYSIGSSPQTKDYFEFYVAVVPDGALTSRLAMLQEGDRLFAAPKVTGTFTLQEVPSQHSLILVATGTGLAPYTSMLRTPGVWTPGRRITLIHGVRYAKDLAYREELEGIAQQNPNLTYIPMVTREEGAWEGRRGRVTTLFDSSSPHALVLEPSRDHVFLCGNPAMIDEMEQALTAQGFREHSKRSPGNLHLERYW